MISFPLETDGTVSDKLENLALCLLFLEETANNYASVYHQGVCVETAYSTSAWAGMGLMLETLRLSLESIAAGSRRADGPTSPAGHAA
ncbi:MAG: hypothetical protein LBQ16_04105 [Gracilibacteraceae bacterium]|jgi:hypothetical protein|nr:hypothetical protein [Gracilibacteraceae bacterium]